MTHLSIIPLPSREEPFLMPWPEKGNLNGIVKFSHAEQWRNFISNLDLDNQAPKIVRSKYIRAQKIYLLGWIDIELIKAGELVALTALELALKDRYGNKFKNNRTLEKLLKYMVVNDGLTDEKIPIAVRCDSTVIGQIVGTSHPSLSQLRNSMAHGDPYDGIPYAGLLELVRDLINFIYRNKEEYEK